MAKNVPHIGITGAVRATFLKEMKGDPSTDIAQAMRRLSQWAAANAIPKGLDYDDLKWMYNQYAAELKSRDPKSTAGGNFPARGSGKASIDDLRLLGDPDDESAQKCRSLTNALGAIRAAAGKRGKAGLKGSMAAMHSAAGADVLEDLYELIDCESEEPAHVALLQDAAALVLKFVQAEHAEIGQPGDDATKARSASGSKSVGELKAEPMEGTQLDRWLGGKIPRRILMVPFGGPLPGGKAGLDLDGEYFDEATDLYGPFPALRTSRERLVDWHHDADPTGVMKGAILGRAVFDESPEDEGYWADFWANAGEKRRDLIAALERRGVPLFGSSQAVRGAVKKAGDGHIEVWPLIRHTITTSPQNTHAVVPPLKALLTADIPPEVGIAALKAALVGLNDLEPSLRSTFGDGGETFRPRGKSAGKAGRVRDLDSIVPEAEKLLVRLRRLTANH